MEYTEKTFRESIYPWTWKVETGQRLSSCVGNRVAAMLFRGEEQHPKFHLRNHLVAKTFFDGSMKITVANQSIPPVGDKMHCTTWARYSVGQFCIAMTGTVPCVERTPPEIASTTHYGPIVSKVLDGTLYNDKPSIYKMFMFFLQDH